MFCRICSQKDVNSQYLVLEAERQPGSRGPQRDRRGGHPLAEDDPLGQPEPRDVSQRAAAQAVVQAAWRVVYGHPALRPVLLQASIQDSRGSLMCHATCCQRGSHRLCNKPQYIFKTSGFFNSIEKSAHSFIMDLQAKKGSFLLVSYEQGRPGAAWT